MQVVERELETSLQQNRVLFTFEMEWMVSACFFLYRKGHKRPTHTLHFPASPTVSEHGQIFSRLCDVLKEPFYSTGFSVTRS